MALLKAADALPGWTHKAVGRRWLSRKRRQIGVGRQPLALARLKDYRRSS